VVREDPRRGPASQLRDDGEIRVVELVERLTKLLGLLQETEAKAQGKTPGTQQEDW
jgi:hypothetical protein